MAMTAGACMNIEYRVDRGINGSGSLLWTAKGLLCYLELLCIRSAAFERLTPARFVWWTERDSTRGVSSPNGHSCCCINGRRTVKVDPFPKPGLSAVIS